MLTLSTCDVTSPLNVVYYADACSCSSLDLCSEVISPWLHADLAGGGVQYIRRSNMIISSPGHLALVKSCIIGQGTRLASQFVSSGTTTRPSPSRPLLPSDPHGLLRTNAGADNLVNFFRLRSTPSDLHYFFTTKSAETTLLCSHPLHPVSFHLFHTFTYYFSDHVFI